MTIPDIDQGSSALIIAAASSTGRAELKYLCKSVASTDSSTVQSSVTTDTPEIEITVNGEQRAATDGQSLSELLVELGLEPATVAIEYNGEVIPRSTFGDERLAAGDRLEIVRFVQGG